MKNMDYSALELRLGYVFKDKSLLKRALTLASADASDNNQTLEFFGDAILEFLVSEKIYGSRDSEGGLTELRKQFVSDKALEPIARNLGLNEYLIRSSGDNDNKKSVPSSYEAVLAAIYLDGGIEQARAFVGRTIPFSPVAPQKNYKGELQEIMQKNGLNAPAYEYEDVGTPRKPYFRSCVEVGGKVFEGYADNKKQADQLAAEQALKWLCAQR